MLIGDRIVSRRAVRIVQMLAVLAAVCVGSSAAYAQNNQGLGVFTGRSVGGVMINAEGLLTSADRNALAESHKLRADALRAVPDAMNRTAGLRKVSLGGLEAEIQKCLDGGKPIPIEVQCLAGLQEIRYLLLYPKEKDIVIVGRAEGWKVHGRGNIVGATSGRPVMLLDDLATALRAALAPVRTPMSCSIDPTPEGTQRWKSMANRLATDPRTAAAGMEQYLGPQTITVDGVPDTSHFARVMVAADYRMKRVSLALERSPVPGLPSYFDMAATGRGTSSAMPRWWIEPVYDPLGRDAEGLAWELRGGRVKAMTENTFFDTHGIARTTGKVDPIAQRWADMFSERYEELAAADPVFGELRNCMDLAVVAALIAKERLTEKAGNRLPLLTGGGGLETAKLPAPKHVATQANAFKGRRGWLIAAGGVQINPWAVVEKAQTDETVTAVHKQSAAKERTSWWWD